MTDQQTFGWQFPWDSGSDESGSAFIFRSLLARFDTIKLCQVIAVHPGAGSPPTAGTVDVQLLVNMIDGDTPPNSQARGVVYGLPYWRLRCGPWEVVGDPAVGDNGVVLCCDRDISVVVKSQAQANPGSQRRFSVSDGLFICFGSAINAAAKATIQLKSDGTIAVTDQSGNTWSSSSAGWSFGVVGATILTLTASLATFAVNVKAPDFVTPTLPSYGGHSHGGVQTGGGTSGPPTGGS